MALDITALPNDVDALKRIVSEYDAEMIRLREQVEYLKHKLFGRKSEQLTEAERRQLYLFNEAELGAGEERDEPPEETIAVPAHFRTKKRGRRPLPENLPRERVVFDIPEADKHCGCGQPKSVIGEEVSEKLDIEPARLTVRQEVRLKYACRHCEGVEDEGPTVQIAPVPPAIIPKGIATPALLAFVLTAKFVDALPFYRQEKQFARLGIELSRQTLCGWAMQVAEACAPVLAQARLALLRGPLIRIDETRVQVLEEEGRAPQTQSYMWLFRGGLPDHPLLEYHYHPTRAGQVAADYLGDFQGLAQTDGYPGYDFLDRRPGIRHAGCWAHVRREFHDVKTVAAGRNRSAATKAGSVDVALDFIRKLYAIEQRAKEQGLTGEALVAVRQAQAKPLLVRFKAWLDQREREVPPKTLLGKAIGYALGQWPRLLVYLDHAVLTPDNNLVENGIRPFVLGRKNWLFAGNPRGAAASAALYSLIETAKANGLDPHRYLHYLFAHVPLARTPEDYAALLASNLTPEQIRLPT
ncbi:MAG: IS66 family transposase [Thermodesulfobacteriota bacterium]